MLIQKAGKTIISNIPVSLGSKFTGKPTLYINEATGEYQHSMPPVDVEVQKSLFKEPSNDQRTTIGYSSLHPGKPANRARTLVCKEPTDPKN